MQAAFIAIIPFVIYIVLGILVAFALIMWTDSKNVPTWQFLIVVNLWPFVLFFILIVKLLNWNK